MVAKADTPSEVQAMCTVRGCPGVWQGLSQDATGSRWQVLSVQKRDLNDDSTNLKPQQPMIGMIFTNADLRYAGRLDNKQDSNTIVTMERVREAIAFNAELADESTWLWLTSEQMGFPLRLTGGGEHEERAEDLDSSRRVRDHLVEYHLAPAITDFISDEDWECCNNELEQTLILLHSEWRKEIESSRQSSTHHPLIVSKPN